MTVKTISLDDVGFKLDDLRGHNILIKVESNGLEMSNYSTIESATVFTTQIVIKMENISKCKIKNEQVNSIEYNDIVSSDNTNSIVIEMTNNQIITIEYEV